MRGRSFAAAERSASPHRHTGSQHLHQLVLGISSGQQDPAIGEQRRPKLGCGSSSAASSDKALRAEWFKVTAKTPSRNQKLCIGSAQAPARRIICYDVVVRMCRATCLEASHLEGNHEFRSLDRRQGVATQHLLQSLLDVLRPWLFRHLQEHQITQNKCRPASEDRLPSGTL